MSLLPTAKELFDPRTLLSIGKGGIAYFRKKQQFGQQDVGLSPGGPMDLLSLQTGNILLGNDPNQAALEILLAPEIEFAQSAYFVLTGAHVEASLIQPNGNSIAIQNAKVAMAPAAAKLKIGNKKRGFRSYLCVRPRQESSLDKALSGRKRGDFRKIFSWADPFGRIRVMEGPEFFRLKNPDVFIGHYWKVSPEVNDMGMRLNGIHQLDAENCNMISDVVADGTVQLTPRGPIVLLRHRQTVGGYPRIFNVISADIDLLAQFGPGSIIRFKKVSLREAVTISQLRNEQILAFRKDYED